MKFINLIFKNKIVLIIFTIWLLVGLIFNIYYFSSEDSKVINNTSNKNININFSGITNNNIQSATPKNWKTISSNIYGYEISFPEGWYWSQGNEQHNPSTNIPITDILISPDQCYFNGDCMSSSAILVRLEVSNMVCNTSQECANYLDYIPGCRMYSDRQSITIDNYEATQQFEYPEEDCATEQDYTSNIFWKKDNSTYNLMGINVNKEDFSKYADVFEKIIKSIKFK